MNKFHFTTCVLIILNTTFVSAQVNYNSYKNAPYTWPDLKPEFSVVNPEFKNQGAVIIKDETTMTIGTSKHLFVEFERHVITSFHTQQAIISMNKIQIPESFDPIFDKNSTPFSTKKDYTGPDYLETQLTSFAARIIKPDGRVIAAEYMGQMKEKEVLSMIWRYDLTYKYFNFHYWDFIFLNLEPGDQLELHYKYNFPHDENFFRLNSNRIFFHRSLPVQQSRFVLRHHVTVGHKFAFVNGCKPDSVLKADNMKNMVLLFHNLPGCINEPGSRPYVTLPYVVFTLDDESRGLEYYDEYTAERKFAPYWLVLMRWRESYDYTMRNNAQNNTKDKQNALVDRFIAQRTEGITDSNTFGKLVVIHNTIADSFRFVSDELLFQELDINSERIGEFTANYKIREISRQKLYAKILSELKYDYFTMYISDNRLGLIDTNYLSPIWNNEYLYSIIVNKSFVMMHPKRSDFGYYLEELPFYWENSTGLLVNSYDLFYKLIEKPRIIETAGSSLNDNLRMSNVMANVDLATKEIDFEARVSLSGQYSTMTRFIYTLNQKDSINNPLYNKKISDISGNVTVKQTEIINSKSSFPYNISVKTKYLKSNGITLTDSDTILIDLSGWFNHITMDLGQDSQRSLDFYPDFVGQDTYRYFVQFTKPVKLISGDQSVNIKNKFGNLECKFTQPQPNVLLIESFFVAAAGKVAAGNIADVRAIYDNISQLNGSTLKLVAQ